ncbi:hypothetical protein [Sphingobacterium anhuiense]|uniref:Uncharacterized protein n=1 Tax=Sphingobacterium anhuiense TaxID=493780 RepID=A0ABW5YX68_9SPHI
MPWFLFTPPSEGIKDPAESNQYIRYNGESKPIQQGSLVKSHVYAIHAISDENLPVITDELIKEMYNAIMLKKDTENILLQRGKNSIKEILKNL